MKLPKVYAMPELAKIRESYGSQKDFVEMLKLYDSDLTLPAYAKYETGERSIPIERAVLIAAFLNKNLYKMFKVDKNAELDKEEKRLLKY
jgi:transcriptional regulator with XRE-family HTH domain